MIKCHLSRLLGERRLKISDVTRDTGINRGTLTRLYHETGERIEFEVLDRLCSYLGCGVGELFEHQKESSSTLAAQQE
jgi:putative transcriptional regulator